MLNFLLIPINKEVKKLKTEKIQVLADLVTSKKKIEDLEKQIQRLNSKKKIEEEEIKHLHKISKEAMEIEFKKKEIDMELKKAKEISDLQKNYYEKTMEKTESIYTEIMKRLPNYNVRVKEERHGS